MQLGDPDLDRVAAEAELLQRAVAGEEAELARQVDEPPFAVVDLRRATGRLELLGDPGQTRVGDHRSFAPRRTRPAPAPASLAGPCGEAMPSTRIAFRPRPSRSRPSVEPTSRPREVADALEPVADGVAVGVEPLGGAGDVAVALEERLQRLHQVGLVLGVVGDERLHGLGVEALELGRVLAHGGEQEAVGAGVLEGQDLERVVDAGGAGLGDVGGQQRLVAGAVEVDGVERDARVADGEREAVQRALELARDRLGDAADALVLRLRDEHDDLAGALGLRGDRRRRASRARSCGRRARRRRARGRASRRRWGRGGGRARRSRRRRGRGRCRAPRRGRRGRRGRSRRGAGRP